MPKTSRQRGPSDAAAGDSGVSEPEAETGAGPVGPDRPAQSAPKSEWVDYAVAVGAVDADDADDYTIAELQAATDDQ
jgi:hypothetical protein